MKGSVMRMIARLPVTLLRGFIHLYRWFLSPLLGARCRFAPSCSEYGLEALAVHGAWRGSWITFRRFIRCHPWGGSGWDPVPGSAAAALPLSSVTSVQTSAISSINPHHHSHRQCRSCH